jgi:hypothetical protein
VAGGWSNAEIGERLHISAATAKTHVSRLLMKVDAHDRAQLVMIAYETRLVTPSRATQRTRRQKGSGTAQGLHAGPRVVDVHLPVGRMVSVWLLDGEQCPVDAVPGHQLRGLRSERPSLWSVTPWASALTSLPAKARRHAIRS